VVFFSQESQFLFRHNLDRKKQEKIVFWGGEGANEIAPPHFGPRFFSTAIKGGVRVKPKKGPQSFSNQLRRIVAFCGKLHQKVANCGELWRIGDNLGRLAIIIKLPCNIMYHCNTCPFKSCPIEHECDILISSARK
jgi:hypothetical protein